MPQISFWLRNQVDAVAQELLQRSDWVIDMFEDYDSSV